MTPITFLLTCAAVLAAAVTITAVVICTVIIKDVMNT